MFNKNFEALNNPALKRRLEKLDPFMTREGITYIVTQSNDYILLKNDVPIDDLKNPREAVREHFNATIKKEMKSNDIIVCFGIGLGYILDEAFNTYPSRILLYEPDLNLLHFVLSNVDISEHLSSERVFLTNDMDELLNKLNEIYITQDKVEIVYLQNYAVVNNKDLLMLTQRVYDTCKTKMVDVSTIAKFSKKWLVNTLNNIHSVNNGNACLLSALEDKFIGQSALVLGAGPSLIDNITKIKANRGSFVIFAVNKVVKYLEQNGIYPDFAVCLDAGNMETTLDINPEYLSRINCITDIRSDETIFSKPFKKIFVNFSDTDFIAKKIAETNPFMKFYESGGTSSIMAMVSAIKMGFSKVVLAGIDLAFKDNTIYADGQVMNRISQDEIVVDSVKKNLVQVKSIDGGMVYTRDDYEAFIHQFENVIKSLNYSNIYNISSFGAYIEGVKPVSFEHLNLMTLANTDILHSIAPFKIDMTNFIQEEFCKINNVISILSKGVFSPELVSCIVKSVLLYQYMQTEILTVLQKNFDRQIAEDFINNTKSSIKTIVDLMLKTK